MKTVKQTLSLLMAATLSTGLLANSAALDLKSDNSELNKRQDLNDVDITYVVTESDRRAFEVGDKTLISSGQQCDMVLAKFSFTEENKLKTKSGLDIVFGATNGENTKISFAPKNQDEIALNYAYSAKTSSGKNVKLDKELNQLDVNKPVYLIMQKSGDDRISIGATNKWPDKKKKQEVGIRFYKTPLTANYESIDFVNNNSNLKVEDISFYDCEGKLPESGFASVNRKTKEDIYY